jgi:hypothetical protein
VHPGRGGPAHTEKGPGRQSARAISAPARRASASTSGPGRFLGPGLWAVPSATFALLTPGGRGRCPLQVGRANVLGTSAERPSALPAVRPGRGRPPSSAASHPPAAELRREPSPAGVPSAAFALLTTGGRGRCPLQVGRANVLDTTPAAGAEAEAPQRSAAAEPRARAPRTPHPAPRSREPQSPNPRRQRKPAAPTSQPVRAMTISVSASRAARAGTSGRPASVARAVSA